MVAENCADRKRFVAVVFARARAMSVDVVDFGRLDPGVGNRQSDRFDRPLAVWMLIRDAKGVGRAAESDHFGQDRGPVIDGMFQSFQNDDAGSFADHEAVARRIKGPTGGSGIVVSHR